MLTAWLASRLLGTLLFGVSPRHPVIYLAVALGILLVGFLANLAEERPGRVDGSDAGVGSSDSAHSERSGFVAGLPVRARTEARTMQDSARIFQPA